MKAARLQWLGMLLSLVVYGVMAFVIVKVAPVPLALSLRQPPVIALYAAGVVLYFAAFLATRRSPPAVRLMMLEAVAIVGFVAAFLVRDGRIYLAPGVLALIGMIRSFPPREAR
jgi:FtsH-binding integral membrane protein